MLQCGNLFINFSVRNMSHFFTRRDLKVDATTLLGVNQQSIVLYNFNIPENIVRDENEFANALDRFSATIQRDFGLNPNVFFQLTASYMLSNHETNEKKLWTGSFHSRDNAPSQLTGFLGFNSATFNQDIISAADNVDDKLLWVGQETKWQFDGLVSLIVCVQVKVRQDDSILRERGLINRNGHRNHITFHLV